MATRFSPARNRFSPSVLPRRRGNIFDAFQRGADAVLESKARREDREFTEESRDRQAAQEELAQETGEAEAFRSGVRLPGTTPIDEGTGLDIGGEGPRSVSQAPTDRLSIRDVFLAEQQRPVVATGPRDENVDRPSAIPGSFKRDVGEFIPGVGKVRLPSGAIIDAETTTQAGDRRAAIERQRTKTEDVETRRIEDERAASTRQRRGEAFVAAGGSQEQAALAGESDSFRGTRTKSGDVDLFTQFRPPTRRGGVTAGERQGLAEIFFNRQRLAGATFEEAVDETNLRFPGSFSPSEARRSEQRTATGDPAMKERRASIVRQLRAAEQELDTPTKQVAVDRLVSGATKVGILREFRDALEARGLDPAQVDAEIENLEFFLGSLPDEIGGPLEESEGDIR